MQGNLPRDRAMVMQQETLKRESKISTSKKELVFLLLHNALIREIQEIVHELAKGECDDATAAPLKARLGTLRYDLYLKI